MNRFINHYFPKFLRWRYFHYFVFRCTHPKECKKCGWCGYNL